ncbi:MAG: aminopeptidase P family protein [Williamsia herbipolensis]|nr:aminopeptidase P family protein [Williamsia herbipolensis]
MTSVTPSLDRPAHDLPPASGESSDGAADPALRATADPAVFTDRIARLADTLGRFGIDAAVIGSGADLAYLVGHSVASHERLTALTVAADGSAALLVPALERAGWTGTPTEALDLPISTWSDGEDQHAAVAAQLPATARVLAVDYYLPAMHVLGLQDAVPGCELRLAGEAIAELRMRKDEAELAALAAVGRAIDRVHARMGEWLRAGRTENEVAADIETAIVAEGHEHADFVIVAAGANGAGPHHRASDSVIREGDPVVVDIGGPAASGYCSDSTRTYVVGAASDPEFESVHEIVRLAQEAGAAAARAGVSCEAVDAASRRVIADAGYGEHFITRTGHGIGLEVHEHPYIVRGNERQLEPGMCFSVEPGIYLPGRFGVRIEDIVAINADGEALRLNNSPRELRTLGRP